MPSRELAVLFPHLVDEERMEVLMDQLERCGAFAAALFTLALVGCGGSPSSDGTAAAAAAASGVSTQAVTGVSTPSSVSVVTATNAD